MLTAQATLDALARYDITDENLATWEKALGLEIPLDTKGYKHYSQHHINLFKNIRKHLALGRTLDQIRAIINLPPADDAVIQEEPPIRDHVAILPEKDPGIRQREAQGKSQFSSKPKPMASNKKAKNIDDIFQQTIAAQRQAEQTKHQKKTAPGSESSSARVAEPTAPQQPHGALHVAPPVAPHVVKERPPKNVSRQPAPPRASSGATEVVDLVKRLTGEKDHLYQKLLETEKLNSHLYSANNLYHRRVKDLEQSIDTLRSQMPFDQNVKLMDDKAKLHKQMLETEKKLAERENELRNSQSAVLELNTNNHRLMQRIEAAKQSFDASAFCGDWMESGHLIEIAYDNFGINVEPERVRLFRVSKAPERVFGNTAVITTNYQYETNPQWRRVETLVAAYIPDHGLEGEVTAEYILDGVPVAKAVYRVHCKRNA